jgi:type IV secretory pathway VirB4 component
MAIKSSKATQEFVPIKEIRDGVVILKDDSLCSILMASSTNFALKSVDEQEAVLMQYRNFLNSLDFPVQFFVQSRKLDIEPYLETLRDTLKNQTNDLLAIQTKEYIGFVKDLVTKTNIVAKSFYVVIPYRPPTISAGSPSSGVLSFLGLGKSSGTTQSNDPFTQNKTQLDQRVIVVQSGLSSTGIKSALLNTEEVIELFYKLYNPGEIEKSLLNSLASVK